MSIWQDIKEYPGTIPFFGFPAGIELDTDRTVWTNVNFDKDIVIKLTFPMGVDDIDDVTAKAVKYFSAEVITQEPNLIILKADLKMVAFTLLFSFRDQYHNI